MGGGVWAACSLSVAIRVGPRLALVVAFFAFIVDLLQQVLVVIELLFVHLAQATILSLLLHLVAQEILVLPIDDRDLALQALLL